MSLNAQRDDIQGLRAIAVLGVLIFHTDKAWLPGGFTGVDIFFVISGFLISSIILRQKDAGSFSFCNFYMSRVRRIVPAYVVMLLIVTLTAVVFLTPEDCKFFKRSLAPALYFNSAQYFAEAGDYFSPSSWQQPLQHTWTLAVEMQFYLLLPLLLYWLPRRATRVVLPILALSLLAWSQHALSVLDLKQSTYFSLPARIPEFLLGTMVALYAPTPGSCSPRLANAMALSGAGLIAAAFVLLNEDSLFPGISALLPCVGTALLIAGGRSVISKGLSWTPLVWIGALSYSIYLWHWPVYAFARYCLMDYTIPVSWLPVLLGAILGASWLSFKLVETPFRTSGFKPLAYRLAPLCGVMLLIAFFARPINQELTAFLDDRTNTGRANDTGFNLAGSPPLSISCSADKEECVFGSDLDTSPRYTVIGDSNAHQLKDFFQIVGQKHQFRVAMRTQPACAPFIPVDLRQRPLTNQKLRDNCVAIQDTYATYAANARVGDVLILGGAWSQYSLEGIRHLEEKAKELSDAGVHVIIVSEIKKLIYDPRRRDRHAALGIDLLAGSDTYEADPTPSEANRVMKDLAQRHSNVTYYDFTDNEFFDTAPYYRQVRVYSDGGHLNSDGSQILGELEKNRFGALIRSLTSPLGAEVIAPE